MVRNCFVVPHEYQYTTVNGYLIRTRGPKKTWLLDHTSVHVPTPTFFIAIYGTESGIVDFEDGTVDVSRGWVIRTGSCLIGSRS